MDFDLNPDDLALIDAMRSFCEGRFPMKVVRELEDDHGVRRDLWRELAATGVFGLRLTEDAGGAGLGMTEAVLVFEEMGRAIVPGPLVGTHLAAGLVEGADSGERVVGMVECHRLPFLIEHWGVLDALLVVGPGGIDEVDPAVLDTRMLPTPFDPLTPVWIVPGYDEGTALPGARRLMGPDSAAIIARQASVLSAALLLGIARRTVEMGVAYAMQRHQFGRPVGSFQAIKHILAECVTKAEVARAAVHAAGVVLDDPTAGSATKASAGAKLLASSAAISNARASIQVHGGIGFTWEADAHLFLKRSMVLSSAFLTPEEAELQLAEAL